MTKCYLCGHPMANLWQESVLRYGLDPTNRRKRHRICNACDDVRKECQLQEKITEQISAGRQLKVIVFHWGREPQMVIATEIELRRGTLPMAAIEALAVFADKVDLSSVRRMVIDAHPDSKDFSQIVIEWYAEGPWGKLRTIKPCGPTCQSHTTHPCENCGVQWGPKGPSKPTAAEKGDIHVL